VRSEVLVCFEDVIDAQYWLNVLARVSSKQAKTAVQGALQVWSDEIQQLRPLLLTRDPSEEKEQMERAANTSLRVYAAISDAAAMEP
jgi:hypothetical protein